MVSFSKIVAAAAVAGASVEATKTEMTMTANPIRRVVTMLQNIQKKVEEEGKRDEELFEKYMCYCKNGVADLEASIAAAETKAADVAAGVEGAAGQKGQLEADLKAAKADRVAAKEAVASAESLREKEAASFKSYKEEQTANIEAVNKAVASLQGGAAAAFLQDGSSATKLRNLVQNNDMTDSDRETVVAFLSGTESSESSGEIVGILQTLGEEMQKDLADAESQETTAVSDFEELVKAKSKEIEALTKSIEEKMERLGELGVGLAEMKNDGGDNANSLEDDKKFLADLKKNCGTKEGEYEQIKKSRAEELLALADTIKMLNDDDSLELFKKTLPSASSFMQVTSTASAMRSEALAAIHEAQKHVKHPKLDFIALALHGKKVGFDKVIAMIDEMSNVLKTEQAEDDKKKQYCEAEFDKADDEKKSVQRSISDAEKAIADAKETVYTLKEEMKTTAAEIKDMDKSVAEATEQRQEENSAYKELMAGNAAAKELLKKAKNRLNKFYNPKLATLAQVKAHSQDQEGQPEAPPAFEKKSEASNGVLALMDTLVADLDKEMTIAETEEKDSQKDYETFTADSKKKRADNIKTLEDKEAAVADAEASLQTNKDTQASASKELMGVDKYITSLHGECDFLLQYYGQRKEARTNELDALGKAKDVLNGADYSFIQVASQKRRFLA